MDIMRSSDLCSSMVISRTISALIIFMTTGCRPYGTDNVQPTLAPTINNQFETSNSEFRGSGKTQQPANFTAYDQIGRGQITEVITLEINGVPLKEIKVTQDHPEIEVIGNVPAEGQFDYRVSGVLVRAEGEKRQTLRLLGAGKIVIRQGSRLALSLLESSPTHGIVVLFALHD